MSLPAAAAVVQEAFDEIRAMRWENVTHLVHPVALARFRSFRLEQARDRERLRGTPEEPRREPGMPDAVAAWFEERRRYREAEDVSWLSREFAGVATVEQLEALTAEEMLARWLEATDARASLSRELEASGLDVGIDAVAESLPVEVREVIGAVEDSEATAQVVYRTRIDHAPSDSDTRIAVATVRRDDDGAWRLWSTWKDYGLFDAFQIGISIDSGEEHLAQLDALKDAPFHWPAEGRPLVSGVVIGYNGDGMRPTGVALQLSLPGGTVDRAEVPMAAMGELVAYLEPWLYLPEG